jgi:hypothetical protein
MLSVMVPTVGERVLLKELVWRNWTMEPELVRQIVTLEDVPTIMEPKGTLESGVVQSD